MHGSVRLGYDGAEKINNEYNVKADVEACRVVFAAPWREKLITPLDTCGLVTLQGADYQQVYKSQTPLAKALMGNYAVWLKAPNHWMQVATKWKNLEGFESWLAGRLAMPTDKGPAVPAP